MSKIAIRAKRLYEMGALTSEQIDAMLEAGKITQAEHDWILGVVPQVEAGEE